MPISPVDIHGLPYYNFTDKGLTESGDHMSHTLTIRHLGPIEHCELTPDKFTVLTGPQSNGKSTVAKAIYFFRTVKQDVLNIMMQGGPARSTGIQNAKWRKTVERRMRDKFLELFGTTWIMPDDLYLKYSFKKDVFIEVKLQPSIDDYEKNYISFEFGQKILDYFEEREQRNYLSMTAGQRKTEEETLAQLLDDDYEAVFIPAGRNLITLLSTQLNYIFTSLEASQLRNIDYLTKRYTELILKMKDSFSAGLTGFAAKAKADPETYPKYKTNQPSINVLLKKSREILQGDYRYVDGDERLYLDPRRYVKINYTSSGQQEIVWVLNLLTYYLVTGKKVLLMIEEPESHLYPNAQQEVAELLSLFVNAGNEVLVTTHSPYILGSFNYMLLAAQTDHSKREMIKQIVDWKNWIAPDHISAWFVEKGEVRSALDSSENCILIQNELIDEASTRINDRSDRILEQMYEEG